MEDTDYRQIITRIKERRNVSHQPANYHMISSSIRGTMKNILRTQKEFEVRSFCERAPILKKGHSLYRQALALVGKNNDWGDLFRMQLGNVGVLNENLVGLIYHANSNLDLMKKRLMNGIDTGESNLSKLQSARTEVPKLDEAYKKLEENGDLDLENTEDYSKLKIKIEAEENLLKGINEVSLLSVVHQKDLEKMELLERHIAIHRGTIFSAKKLALGTNQICDSLNNLVDIYEHIDPMKKCLEGVYEGVGTLKGYTNNLAQLYQGSFDVIKTIESGDKNDILEISSQNLDTLVGQIMEAQIPDEYPAEKN